MLFISPQKLFSFSRYLNICLDCFGYLVNGLIRKVNFKIRDFINWETNNLTIQILSMT